MLAKKAMAATASAPKVYVEDVFSTFLYTGNGSTQTITNNIDLSGKGGLVWIKPRNQAYHGALFDTQRGAGKILYSSLTNLEETHSNSLTSFTSSGFSLGSDSSFTSNSNNTTHASWTFREAEKFFDVVTYSGNGTAGRQISHNLGSVPGVIIVKVISGAANDWQVYHRSLGNTKYLRLNTNDTELTATSRWNDTTPTSTYFVVGSNSSVNASGSNYVAYLFAHDAGGFGDAGDQSVIKCGSYTGNGSATGPTIDLGWEVQWLLVKSTTASGSHWYLMDATRGMAYNGAFELYPNLSASDTAQSKNVVPTATGFQVLTTDGYLNQNTATYVYIAIRRGPMKTPTSGTDVFSPILATDTEGQGTVKTTNFPIDLQITKATTSSGSNFTSDRLRGFSSTLTDSGNVLVTNDIAAETTAHAVTRYWTNTGFQISSAIGNSNQVYWNFRRAPSFMDIVCYTGNGTSGRTVSHNLGVAPELMIVKRRDSTNRWATYVAPLGATHRMLVELTNAAQADSTYWNNTAPTATVFTVGNSVQTNVSDSPYVAYLFGSVTGVSKVGSYTGNGSSQTINCGFTNGARFILIKRTDDNGDWYVFDTVRGIVSGNDPYLRFNLSTAQQNYDAIDPDNSGFIVNNDATNFPINVNNATYIYLAIA